MPKTILLLLCTWCALYGIADELGQRQVMQRNWRLNFLFATIAWGAIVVAITEILSLFHLITRNGLIVAWSIVFLFATSSLLLLRHNRVRWRSPQISLMTNFSDRMIVILVTSIVVLSLILVMTGLIYPPNNLDSFIYHLPRVVYWQQNSSVSHYATHNDMQLYMPPFAEFVILHINTLTIGDNWANTVQWFAMIGSLIGVAEIARLLGAGARGQAAAALLTVAIPVGLMQSTNTKNDYVLALWMVSLAVMTLSLFERSTWLYTVGFGISLGLAILTKGTALILAFPLSFTAIVIIYFRHRRQFIKHSLIIFILAMSICSGHFIRNYILYQSIFGPYQGHNNEVFTFPVFASSILRNITISISYHGNLPMLNIIGERGRDFLFLVHSFIPLDSADPSISMAGANPFTLPLDQYMFDEDYMGNLVHTVIIIIAVAWGSIKSLEKRDFTLFVVIWILVITFLLFSLMFKWQIWGNRLLLPLFVLWCPVLARVFAGPREIAAAMLAIMVAFLGLPWVFNNATRPIRVDVLMKPREQQYFNKMGGYYEGYRKAADIITRNNCNRVGLILGDFTAEYPFWILLQNRGFQGLIFHHHVTHISVQDLIDNTSLHSPCAVFATFPDGKPPTENRTYTALLNDVKNYKYTEVWLDGVTLYVPRGSSLPHTPDVQANPGLMIYLESGWHDFEADSQIRWMARSSRLWIHSEEAGRVQIKLLPFQIVGNETWVDHGMMQIILNSETKQIATVNVDQFTTVELSLEQGNNLLELENLGGDIVVGGRALGVAFKPLVFTRLP